MTIKINEELCTGCGVCESLCPDVFQIRESDEKAEVVNPNGCDSCDCQEAVESCPAEAIVIEEG